MPTNRTITSSTGTNREGSAYSHIWSDTNTPFDPDSSLPWEDEEVVYEIAPTNRSIS